MKNRILLFAFTLLWNVLVAHTNPVDQPSLLKLRNSMEQPIWGKLFPMMAERYYWKHLILVKYIFQKMR